MVAAIGIVGLNQALIALLIAVGGYPFYVVLMSGAINPYAVFGLAAVIASLVAGTFGALASGLFPTNLRFSGLAMSYNIAAALLGGFTPLATSLLTSTTKDRAAPGFFIAAVSVIGFLCVVAVARRKVKLSDRRSCSII
ncbi:Proline/betaine transporter [Pandoraea capi]|uniref:Proline/betaine transporter n=1 Tax=Pandoraea capi TaxID=2508286 RepID=A0ABY6W4Z2_9BURK|nr:MHS family MFS transporter [Pandoraea capi]VVE27265.1 Proline/betaine transporter [Pandoraea capi]